MDSLTNEEYRYFVVQKKDKIRKSQYEVMKAVNVELINLYWGIGKVLEKELYVEFK